VRQGLGDVQLLSAVARLTIVLAIVNAVVALAANKWRDDRPNDRFPGIVQDVTVIAIFTTVSTVILREQLLTTSAVGAVVVGFALQDTLGNLFAGLAIQIEKPFRVGHWVQVADREGQVQEVTWRATKLRTKAGQFLIVPNSVIAKELVLNYSEPTVPTRIEVEVGASYLTPPNDVKAAMHEAVANSPLALKSPEPQVVVTGFGASSIDYLAQFWIGDYATDRMARDQVRTNIWYTFRRHNIEIPWPIQVEYHRTDAPTRSEADVERAAHSLASVDLFAVLTPESRLELAAASREHMFSAGEAIVHQAAPGASMFVVLQGLVHVVVEPSGHVVATISAGGFFGEMSMLTGEARTATVRAVDESRVLEVDAAAFGALAATHPTLLDEISKAVTSRQAGLDEARASAAAIEPQAGRQSLIERMRRFLLRPH